MISVNSTEIRVCDVCRLLEFDESAKLCVYCNLCDAWICLQDIPRWGRRLQAATKRKLESSFSGQPDYVEKMQELLKNTEFQVSSSTP